MNRDFTINFKDKNMKKGNFMFKVLLMLIAGIFLSIDAFAQQITVKGIVKVKFFSSAGIENKYHLLRF